MSFQPVFTLADTTTLKYEKDADAITVAGTATLKNYGLAVATLKVVISPGAPGDVLEYTGTATGKNPVYDAASYTLTVTTTEPENDAKLIKFKTSGSSGHRTLQFTVQRDQKMASPAVTGGHDDDDYLAGAIIGNMLVAVGDNSGASTSLITTSDMSGDTRTAARYVGDTTAANIQVDVAGYSATSFLSAGQVNYSGVAAADLTATAPSVKVYATDTGTGLDNSDDDLIKVVAHPSADKFFGLVNNSTGSNSLVSIDPAGADAAAKYQATTITVAGVTAPAGSVDICVAGDKLVVVTPTGQLDYMCGLDGSGAEAFTYVSTDTAHDDNTKVLITSVVATSSMIFGFAGASGKVFSSPFTTPKWTLVATGVDTTTDAWLFADACSSGSEVFAVGANAAADKNVCLHYNGTVWAAIDLEAAGFTHATAIAKWCDYSTGLWVGGGGGTGAHKLGAKILATGPDQESSAVKRTIVVDYGDDDDSNLGMILGIVFGVLALGALVVVGYQQGWFGKMGKKGAEGYADPAPGYDIHF